MASWVHAFSLHFTTLDTGSQIVYCGHMVSSKVVGKRLYYARIDEGLSPEQFGAEVGCSGMTIRRLEDGRLKRPTARTMMLISKRLGVPPRELFNL